MSTSLSSPEATAPEPEPPEVPEHETVSVDPSLSVASTGDAEASAASSVPPIDAKLRVPGYEVIEPLGRGGMAAVHLAERRGTAGVPVRCVLKTVLPEHAARPGFQRRFLDEARIISQLHHPNIVSTLDVGVTDDQLYMAMEWVDGIDVAHMMMRLQRKDLEFPLRHLVYILRESLKGLNYAHTAVGPEGAPLRIVHRDVSPGNILISRQGAVKLADFGVALGTPAHRTSSKARLAGKIHYFAPDFFRGDRLATPATDIFSMGVCLYEMLTLRPLFSRRLDLKALKERLLRFDPSILLEGDLTIPEPLEEILLTALAPRPEDRFGSALEFLETVNDYVYESGMRLLDAHFARWVEQALGPTGAR